MQGSLDRGFRTRLIAVAGCLLAAGAWLVVRVTWGWLLTRPCGSFHDLGALVFVVYIFPLTLGAWFAGGPVAPALGGCAAKRVRSGKGTSRHGELAWAGILLSRVMLWGGVGLRLLVLFLGLVRAAVR